MIARRGVAHGSGLGKVRWVVERAFAWLHQSKRLRIRYERRADPSTRSRARAMTASSPCSQKTWPSHPTALDFNSPGVI